MPLGRDTLVPDGNSNGRLQYIRYGDANDSAAQLVVGNYYDSFGNITVSDRDFNRSAFDHGAFSYDAQQRLTSGYGVNYAYDAAGRLTTYEGLATTVNNAFPVHALKNPGYSYDANGNLVTRPGQTLTWNAENQLASVTGNGVSESYTYDANGQRVRKVSNGVTTYYPNQYYEQTGATITKYHYFNGQRVSLHTNAPGGWVHYDLHGDHLGSTVLTTYQGGAPLTRQNYFAYGKYRPGDNGLQTDHRFTGQQGDATGLLYYGARYYDPQLGQFISPDTLVPDATNLFDYNRYMYARGNPMKYNDPTGHCATYNSGTPDANDSECWRYANTILAQWDNTPDYWNERFYSKEAFKYVAANPDNHADGFHDAFLQYLKSEQYKAWSAQHQDKSSQLLDWRWGDYTAVTGTFTPFEGSIIRDDYGHWYFKGALAIGTPGLSLKRGEIFLNTAKGYVKFDQLNLTAEQASERIQQVMEGASWGASGGAVIFTTGPAENLTAPYDVTIESGIAFPPGIGASYSPWGYTMPFGR